jgi:(p)ppGpp synthase/HD superfamily hydrolase
MVDKKQINDAVMFAIEAHGDQRRKYTGEPYVTHTIHVANILEKEVSHTTEMIVAAILHDVVEDTPVTLRDIKEKFGDTVAEYVHYCTNVSEKDDGNRAFRKKMDADHFSLGPAESQTIKIADLLSNAESIIKHDQKFFHKAFKHEKQYMLNILTKADANLLYKAQTVLNENWDKK